MLDQLKDDLLDYKNKGLLNIKQLSECINLQIFKDFQDEIDRASFGLYGL